MTWNIRSLRDDRDAVIEVIAAFAPDLLLLQEAPRFLRARSRLAALARESGMLVGVGDGAEVAVLTSFRLDVGQARTVALSRSRGLHRRSVALIRVSFPEQSVVAAAVHLGLDPIERTRHAAEIRALLRKASSGSPVIGADVNELSSGKAWRELGADLFDVGSPRDEPTFPADDPRRRIDTVFVPPHWSVTPVRATDVGCDAELARASDHRPVVVDVVG